MQRPFCFLVYLFILLTARYTDCFAQQYPFVHYTPRDGLISNQIQNIYQDSKGRLYFGSAHGLSIYDGSRFVNYNSKNGLNFDFVNCVLEVGPDSVWVITNSGKINCLVKGKMKLLSFPDVGHIINSICRDQKGDLYVAAEEGLLLFNGKDHFTRL